MKNMFRLVRSGGFLFIMFCLFTTNPLRAQWSIDPAVNTATSTAANDQFNPKSAGDGAGGAIITWTDNRPGTSSDIYAQRIDATGAVKWTADGIAICAAADNQINATIISDGSGGAIMTWQDRRNGSYHIYAQRIDASGAVQWTPDGVAICTASVSQSSPALVGDGSGGAIITWETNAHTVYAQRVNAAGTAQWTANGVPICTVTFIAQSLPVIVSDGSGGAIIAWGDYRNGTNYDVYAQRINGSGTVQWLAEGIVVSATTNEQSTPAMTADGAGGAVIAWKDYRSGTNNDIYAQRINSSGVAQWTADGVAICTSSNDQLSSAIFGDNAGGAIVVWKDFRDGSENHIYAQRVDASGAPQWALNGVAVCTVTGNQYVPVVISDGSTGVEIAWQDNRSAGGTGVYAQRLDVSGAAQWTVGGTKIGSSANPPTMVSSGAGGSIIAWADYRSGTNFDIYASEVNATGVLPVELTSITASSKQNTVELEWNTATETNNYGFEIERRTAQNSGDGIKDDGAQWTKAGFVEGAGTSNSPKKYLFNDTHLSAGRYQYRLKQLDRDGNFKYSEAVKVEVGATPNVFGVSQNYPNPFNPTTNIRFTVPVTGKATLKVFNTLGQVVATLFDGIAEAGEYYQVTFSAKGGSAPGGNAANLADGVYFARLQSGDRTEMIKMLLMK